MDFGSLLHVAQANEHKAKKETKKCYNTSFSAPKKEQKVTKSLSDNIQKFLARKEEEEKRKEQEAKKKRDELLALRSQDGKAKKRVAAMLKRTKAANKSAIEDAVDDINTAVTLDGPSQPDEDDYGYVSQEASAYYNKLMDKYNSVPVEEPLFSEKKKHFHKDLNSTKDRVRMALVKQEEEEMMPHKRKRKSKSKKDDDDPGDTTVSYQCSDLRDLGSSKCEENSDEDLESERQPVKPKVKRPLPPPSLNFYDLLQLAEKKQFEPIKIEPKKKPEEEDQRPMTKKQKIEYLKEQEWRKRKEEAAKTGRVSTSSSQTPRIPKINSKEDSMPNIKSNDERVQKPNGPGQVMRIPKLNSMKKEERTSSSKGEERSFSIPKKEERSINNVKRENQSSFQKNSQQNGSVSRQNTHNVSLIRNSFNKEDKPFKKAIRDNDVSKKQRSDNENNLIRKSSIHSEGALERSKGYRSDTMNSYPNAKCLPPKPNGKQNDSSVIKSTSSGYDRKLQEAIMAKMQESQRKKRLEDSVSGKFSGKPGKDALPKLTKETEKNNPNMKVQGKIPSKMNCYLEQKLNLGNQKLSNFGDNRPSPDINNTQKRPSTVPSVKPKIVPSVGKVVPSLSKLPVGDVRAKPLPQPGAPSQMKKAVASSSQSKLMPPPEAPGPKQILPKAHPKQFPPADVRPRQFPPSDVRPKQFPPPDVRRKPKPPLKRRITDSEEEYDPEMDDFIDDGPEEEEDYSQHIREIFGYDRRKYSRIEDDDDDECMESNFATILKEDFISTKTGIMEDLEDIRREKEMERRKKLSKKSKL